MRDEVYNACMEAQRNKEPAFYERIAKQFGYPNKENLRSSFRAEKKRRGDNTSNDDIKNYFSEEHTAYEQGDNYINIVCSTKRKLTKEDIILENNIDMTKWKIEKFIVRTDEAWRKDRKVKWIVEDGSLVTGNVDDSGKILIVPITRIEIRFVPITLKKLDSEDLITFYKNRNFISTTNFPIHDVLERDEILEWDITDCHIGARFYDRNWSDLDTIFPRITNDVISSISGRKFKKILMPFLGDIFHFQTRHQRTERNEQQVESNGMNPLEMFDFAKDMFISAIDRLLQHAPVEIVYVPGNHDGDSLYYLLSSLASYYQNVPIFSANLGHESQKYYSLGKNLLGLEHGDAPKRNQVHWLQNVARKEWGESQYAEVHYGHLHSEEVSEFGGVKLRRLPTIAPTDFWHHRNQYVGAIRASMCFVWDLNKIGWTQMWQSTGI